MNEKPILEDFYASIHNAIQMMIDCQPKYEVRGFYLVKVIVPTEIYNILKCNSTKVVKSLDENAVSICETYMGIPIEEDKLIQRTRYVIEGELKML